MFFETEVNQVKWCVAYDKAIRDDGSYLFEKRLSPAFLADQRKFLGSYIFAHQYQNEIIPSEDQDFKKEWLLYYDSLPKNLTTVVVIDPAISLDQDACYTSLVALSCDEANHRYLRVAKRMRITATQTVDLIFKVYEALKPQLIGVETVAYQMALMHFLMAETKKRNLERAKDKKPSIALPLHGIKRAPDKSKMTRIRSLVPWFEWQDTSVKQGLSDFEDEYLKFPRGSYVDILDALADAQELIYPPQKPKEWTKAPPPNHPDYEKWFIRQQMKKQRDEE